MANIEYADPFGSYLRAHRRVKKQSLIKVWRLGAFVRRTCRRKYRHGICHLNSANRRLKQDNRRIRAK